MNAMGQGPAPDEWSERCWDLGRKTGSVMGAEEVAAMLGEQVPERPATIEATHGEVTVSVRCPRGQAAQWAAWVQAICRQNRWPEGVVTR